MKQPAIIVDPNTVNTAVQQIRLAAVLHDKRTELQYVCGSSQEADAIAARLSVLERARVRLFWRLG